MLGIQRFVTRATNRLRAHELTLFDPRPISVNKGCQEVSAAHGRGRGSLRSRQRPRWLSGRGGTTGRTSRATRGASSLKDWGGLLQVVFFCVVPEGSEADTQQFRGF